jgi:hypothetical protein
VPGPGDLGYNYPPLPLRAKVSEEAERQTVLSLGAVVRLSYRTHGTSSDSTPTVVRRQDSPKPKSHDFLPGEEEWRCRKRPSRPSPRSNRQPESTQRKTQSREKASDAKPTLGKKRPPCHTVHALK